MNCNKRLTTSLVLIGLVVILFSYEAYRKNVRNKKNNKKNDENGMLLKQAIATPWLGNIGASTHMV